MECIYNFNIQEKELLSFEYELGAHSERVFDSDLVVISPGIPKNIPILKKCLKKNIPIVGEIEFA